MDICVSLIVISDANFNILCNVLGSDQISLPELDLKLTLNL